MSLLIGLAVGASWLLCLWLGYRIGYGEGREDERWDPES